MIRAQLTILLATIQLYSVQYPPQHSTASNAHKGWLVKLETNITIHRVLIQLMKDIGGHVCVFWVQYIVWVRQVNSKNSRQFWVVSLFTTSLNHSAIILSARDCCFFVESDAHAKESCGIFLLEQKGHSWPTRRISLYTLCAEGKAWTKQFQMRERFFRCTYVGNRLWCPIEKNYLQVEASLMSTFLWPFTTFTSSTIVGREAKVRNTLYFLSSFKDNMEVAPIWNSLTIGEKLLTSVIELTNCLIIWDSWTWIIFHLRSGDRKRRDRTYGRQIYSLIQLHWLATSGKLYCR